MKFSVITVAEPDIENNVYTPERQLWMAVIERALKDYCFFFDKLHASGKGQILSYNPYKEGKQQSFQIRAIKELNRLRWFIFCKEAEEFNLTFLVQIFYEDSEGILEKIRAMAIAQFKKNFDEATKLGLFEELRAYVSQFTAVDTWTPAEDYVPLRQKRYRN